MFSPPATPRCDAAQVQKTLRVSLFSARNQERLRNPLNPGPSAADLFSAQFSDVKEIGYISADRSRGCTATLNAGGAVVPMAYTIAPNEQGDITVRGMDPRIVRTRYGQVDKNGKPMDRGQPAGAARLTAAFERAVEEFDKRPQNVARQAQREQERQRRGLAPETDRRSVRNVMPIGDCKQTATSLWSCRMQAEYRDRLMSAIGRSDWQVLEGDFDFVQTGDTWRAGDDFTRQYLYSIVRGRVEDMAGEDAAARLEDGLRKREADSPKAPAPAGERAPPPLHNGRSDGGVINF